MSCSVRITKIYDRSWSIDEGRVRYFILEGDDYALMIDSGMMSENVREIAARVTDKPLKLINTHADPDHTNGNKEFESFFMDPAESINYYKLHNGTGRLIPVYDKDVLNLGGRPVKIISLPGHTPGSIGILDINAGALFSGDTVQENSNIYMFGSQREMHSYIESLRRLLELAGTFTDIYPSHGTELLTADTVNRLIDAAEDVLYGRSNGKAADVHGHAVLLHDFGFAGFYYER